MSGRYDSDKRPTHSEMLRKLVKVTIPEKEKKHEKKKMALRKKRTREHSGVLSRNE